MRNDLLSIGEVARLKSVSVKALRYYEKIGVFIPAHVDPHSGYRYYSLNQMFDLDVILTCIDLGIPLKEVLTFRTAEGTLDLQSLLETGRDIALDNLKHAQMALRQIDSSLEEIALQKELRTQPNGYTRTLVPSPALLAPWDGDDFNGTAYIKHMTDLYDRAIQAKATPMLFQGLLIETAKGAFDCTLYLAVDEPETDGAEIMPGGTFECVRIEDPSSTACFNAAFDLARRTPGSYVISEVWDAELPSSLYVVELARRVAD